MHYGKINYQRICIVIHHRINVLCCNYYVKVHFFEDVNHTVSIYHLNTYEHYYLYNASNNITTHKLCYMNCSLYFLHFGHEWQSSDRTLCNANKNLQYYYILYINHTNHIRVPLVRIILVPDIKKEMI